jgi:hypothetical protein
MGFRESLLKGKIDGLKRNIAITEKISPKSERIQALKEQLAVTEAKLEQLRNPN